MILDYHPIKPCPWSKASLGIQHNLYSLSLAPWASIFLSSSQKNLLSLLTFLNKMVIKKIWSYTKEVLRGNHKKRGTERGVDCLPIPLSPRKELSLSSSNWMSSIPSLIRGKEKATSFRKSSPKSFKFLV